MPFIIFIQFKLKIYLLLIHLFILLLTELFGSYNNLIKSLLVFSGIQNFWSFIAFLFFVDFSVLGHFHATFMKDITVYGATKFSVTAITESLRELMCVQNLPIRVTVICY